MSFCIWLVFVLQSLEVAIACSRVPFGTTASKSPVDENYVITIAGNPTTYIPGEKYNGKLFFIL